MGTFRLYSGDDGQSHIETIDLDQTPDWKSAQDVTTISFSEAPAGRFSDWHPAPRRQFVIILAGATGDRAGRRLQARLRPRRRPSGGGYDRPRPHHRYARRPGLCHLHHPPGQPVDQRCSSSGLRSGLGVLHPSPLLFSQAPRNGRRAVLETRTETPCGEEEFGQ